MWQQRARRARFLAEVHPASREILTFYAGLAEWQGHIPSPPGKGRRAEGAPGEGLRSLSRFFPSLLDLVIRTGPAVLSAAAHELGTTDFDPLLREYWESPGNFSPRQFFARAILQPYAASFPAGLDCPWCSQPPQTGCLRPQGEGVALDLVCGLCLRRRGFPRTRCAGCNESSESKIANLTAPDFPHLRIQACETCHGYFLVVDLSRDPAAIPEVDELAGLPLDLWAVEHGYQKLLANLAGL